ncbi:hypothetical protein M405DRAFT_835386 [Rhizopogon salebrosus TDB-379]|nr:hypothetical protein M405DRAFT_835386 [Rhizopogon salebrosus TDB-379]
MLNYIPFFAASCSGILQLNLNFRVSHQPTFCCYNAFARALGSFISVGLVCIYFFTAVDFASAWAV